MQKASLRILAMAGSSLGLAILATPAFAQSEVAAPPENEETGGLTEITVTARRVTESLQDVPTSIGALGAEEIANRQIASLTDLKGAVANLSIVKTTLAGGNFMSIRSKTGIAIPNVSVDSSVGFLVDGIYYGRPQSSGGEVADIERIEVLRGPQGTLFGRNSSAGAINFITRKPSGEFGLEADLAYGNYDRKRVRVSLDTPTVAGFAARLTFLHEDYDGDVVNSRPGSVYDFAAPWRDIVTADRFGGLDTESLMFKLRYDDGGPFTAEYKYDWTNRLETPYPQQPLGFAPGFSSWLATSPDSPFGDGILGLYQMQRPGDVTPSFTRLDRQAADSTAQSEIEVQGHMLTLGWKFDPQTELRSISAYRKLKTFAGSEIDGGFWTLPISATDRVPICMACSETISEQWQVSTELQLIGNHDRFSYILGGYYFRERGVSDLPLMNFFAILPPPPVAIPTSGPNNAFAFGQREIAYNTSYAGYVHAEYRIIDPLNVAAGLRYSHDKREMYDNRDPLPVGSPFYSTVSFSKLTWDVALTYTVSPDVNVYAKVATGYQSGGIVRGAVFRPETNTTYEIGLKSEFLNRRVRLNAALFHTKYEDVQIAGFDPFFGLYALNSGTLVTKGGELELTVVPTRGLTINGNFGYSTYENSQGLGRQAPATSISFSAQYDAPRFANGSFISARVDGDYRSMYYSAGVLLPTSLLADPAFPLPAYVWQGEGYASEQAYFDAVFKASELGNYTLVNARLSLVDIPLGSAKVRASAYVRNIFDVDSAVFGSNNGIFVDATFERPRTYGVELNFSF